MRDPIHWIEAEKTRTKPISPFQRSRFRPARRRFHQRPPAENDENTDRVKTDSRNFKPNHPENSDRAGSKAAPVVSWKLRVLETSIEEMKINDPGNSERFRNIEPEQPLHYRRL